MAKYVSVKGWLECEHQQAEEIHKIISNFECEEDFEKIIGHESMELYNKGWCFQKEIINWTSYVFYGADIKEYCLDFMKEEIKEIVRECPGIEGMFFFEYEEGEMRCWKIINSKIMEVQD